MEGNDLDDDFGDDFDPFSDDSDDDDGVDPDRTHDGFFDD
jgi:hypothetical protein